jgi:tetratricopeptide (TPR) repeat protein
MRELPSLTDARSAAGDQRPPSSPPSLHRPLRTITVWLLRLWWILVLCAAIAVLVYLALPVRALTPDHWLREVQSRLFSLVARAYALAHAHPLPSAEAATAIVACTTLAYIASRYVHRTAHRGDTAGTQTRPGQERPAHRMDAPLGPQREEHLAPRSPRSGSLLGVRRILISSTYVDLKAHRSDVDRFLRSMNQQVVEMADFGSDRKDPKTVSLRELASVDYVVLIVAWRYGFVPKGQTHSITELEYDEALQRGLPVFVYLADPATEADHGRRALFPASTRNRKHARQLKAFRQRLADQSTITYDTFTTPEDLSARVVSAVARYILNEDQPAALAPLEAKGRVIALDDMPAHGSLVGRDDELDQLATRLRAGEAGTIVACQGSAGMGKTALAAKVVEQFADDKRTFPGGVIWLDCSGLEGTTKLLALLTHVARLLGRRDLASLADLEACREGLAAVLHKRDQTLLILDNLAQGSDPEIAVRTLHVPGHTALLITARHQVAESLAHPLPIPALTAEKATELFSQRRRRDTGGTRRTREEEDGVPGLMEAVGGVPLAINLLAADAGRKKTRLATLESELANAGVSAHAFGSDPAGALKKTVDLFWKALSAQQQQLFAGLGILSETAFPVEAACALADAVTGSDSGDKTVVDSHDTGDLLGDLLRAGLVEPLAGGLLHLNPVLRDYARDQLGRLHQEIRDRLGDAMLAFWIDYAQAHRGLEGIDALEAEAPGLLEAIEWAYEQQRWKAVVDLVFALNQAWHFRGRRAEEMEFRPWAVEAAREQGDWEALRFMLHELAVLEAETGNYQQARSSYQEALPLAHQLHDKAAIQAELHGVAVLDFEAHQREYGQTGEAKKTLERARAGLETALELARELYDKARIQTELHSLAVLDAEDDNPQSARERSVEALALARERKDIGTQSRELRALASLDMRQGEMHAARSKLAPAVVFALQARQPALIAEATWWQAELERLEGGRDAACNDFRRALSIYHKLRHPDVGITRKRLRELGCEP